MYNITGLTPSTRYTISVAAVNNGGTGPYSDPPFTVQTQSSTDGTNDRENNIMYNIPLLCTQMLLLISELM